MLDRGQFMDQHRDLMEEAIRIDDERGTHGKIVLIEDCIEVSGSFLLHYFTKRSLCTSTSGILIFITVCQNFSHYDRILRKMGCNLSIHREKNRLFFLDMYMPEHPCEDMLVDLYGQVHEVVMMVETGNPITILVDDISILEVAAHDFRNDVLVFMHYCRTLALDYGCMLVLLCHGDIYVDIDTPGSLLLARHFSDVVLSVGQLATGSSDDVHGQVKIYRKGMWDGMDEIQNLHFKVKETCVSYFSPGAIHSGKS